MSAIKQASDYNFRFLDDATKMLLGYFVHTWYRHYLAGITENYRRLFQNGIIKNLTEPADEGHYSMLFDFNALNMEKISYINGIYFYILAAHKGANYSLMHRHEKKQVLYLRGYDFEGSLTTGEGYAMGFASVDTMQFTDKLGELLSQNCQLYKIMSPKDVYWETAAAQKYFYGNFGDMIPLARYRMCSFFLNALSWQDDVTFLLDRMDHYLVYVSSITPSVLWELEQLATDKRRDRVTVIFDEEAIRNKKMQIGVRDGMQKKFGDKLIWSKKETPPPINPEQFRKTLSEKFLVTDPDSFEKDIEMHRQRISQSSAHLPPGKREAWLEFRFKPSLENSLLKELHNFSAEIENHISDWTGDRGIDCLPLFLNFVQFRIFMTLLLGDHFETGRALAAYTAIMQGTYDYYTAPGEKAGALSEEGRERHLNMLTDHLEMARHIGWCMLSFGKSNEFDDLRILAETTFNAVFSKTKAAVDCFFATVTDLNNKG
jgi:hypothetical protein